MPTVSVTVGGTALPGDITALKRSDELLWSEGTGRSADSGAMVGSVVAQKLTYTIEWGVVPQSSFNAIRNAIGSGFMSLVVSVGNSTVANTTVYRSNITGDLLGVFGGVAYYKGVSVELIER